MRSPERLRQRIVMHTWEAAYPYVKPAEEYSWRMAARDEEKALREYFKHNRPARAAIVNHIGY